MEDKRIVMDPRTSTMEQEFEREMGFPFDPNRYEMSLEEGAVGYDDDAYSTLVIHEKTQNKAEEFELTEVGRVDFDPATMNPEAEFERQMGFPFDPDKYEIRRDEGANGFDDDVYEQLVFFEKTPKKANEFDLVSIGKQELLENQTPEQVFEQTMGFPFDPEKYFIGAPGAEDDGLDNPINYVEFFEKVPRTQAQTQGQDVVQQAPNPGPEGNAKPEPAKEVVVDNSQQTFQPPAVVPQPDTERDEAMQNYRNSGYGQNADGHYFNPNTDEYDQNYDPVQDPLFNKKIRSALTAGLTDEELLIKTMRVHNQMGAILGEYPYIGIDKTNIFDDKYNLSEDDKRAFNIDRKFVEEVANVAPNVLHQYAGLLDKLDNHRKKMAEIMGKEPYPGIEDENIEDYINDISRQYDDWEIDQLRENKEAIDEMKRKFPPLFENVYKKQKDEDKTQGNTPTPPGPGGTSNSGDGTNGNTDDDNKDKTDDDNKDKTDDDNKDKTDDDNKGKTDDDEDLDMPEEKFHLSDKQKAFLKKALAFAGGIAVGVGLSCVPGVGQIRMGIAAAKLVTTVGRIGINIYTKRHPESKLAQEVNDLKNRWNNSVIGKKVNEINEKLHKPPINAFINGVSVGYIAGNIVELVTGQTVLENIVDKFKPDPVIPQPVVPDPVAPDPVPPEPTVVDNIGITPTPPPGPTPIQIPPDDVITEMVKSGQEVDLSSIAYGRVSSDAANAVKLIQDAGKDVHFLREVTLGDGTVMWAMDQSNGLGYAWFPKQEVLDAIKQMGQTAGRTL